LLWLFFYHLGAAIHRTPIIAGDARRFSFSSVALQPFIVGSAPSVWLSCPKYGMDTSTCIKIAFHAIPNGIIFLGQWTKIPLIKSVISEGTRQAPWIPRSLPSDSHAIILPAIGQEVSYLVHRVDYPKASGTIRDISSVRVLRILSQEEVSDVSVIFMCVVSIKGPTILMRIVPHLKNIS
jgi:hypothetical protein